jgi:hypothetical protein
MPPEKPVSPKRLIIILGGLAGGLGLATGVIVLLELLNKTVRRPTDLEAIELQALVTVPYIATPGETQKRKLLPTPAILLLLYSLPAMLVLLHYGWLDLGSRF